MVPRPTANYTKQNLKNQNKFKEVITINKTVPTLNICEATRRFREYGISTSEVVLGAGIEQGLYPFGICIKTEKGRRFEIYEKMLDEYLQARAASQL